MTAQGCAGHSSLAEDLRRYADGALDLLEPLLERVREQPADPARPEPASCGSCPVCAVITVLRGGRSELAVQLADQVTELLAVLRTALAEGAGEPTAAPEPPDGTTGTLTTRVAPERRAAPHRPMSHRSPRVQHISVARR